MEEFVDNRFVVQDTEHKESFLQHINSIDSVIKLTVEDTWADGSMPFLDILVTSEPNKTLPYVCRNPTIQTNTYLQTATTT